MGITHWVKYLKYANAQQSSISTGFGIGNARRGSRIQVLITYDVSTQDSNGRKRLRKVAKECVNYGQRVQNSVFECILDSSQLLLLKDKLVSMINEQEDSLRFYYLGNKYQTKVEHFGVKTSYEAEGTLII